MLHQSGGVQRPISSVFSLSFGQGHRGERVTGRSKAPPADQRWTALGARHRRFGLTTRRPGWLAGWLARSLNPSRVASAPQKGATVCPSLQCQRIGHVHAYLKQKKILWFQFHELENQRTQSVLVNGRA
jgi:hypothetical protein